MDHEQWVNLIGNGLLLLAAPIATASVVAHSRVAWRRSPMGRHLMAYMAAIAAVLDLGVVRLLLGFDSFAFQLLRLAVFAAIPVVLGWRFWLQVKARRLDRADAAAAAALAAAEDTRDA